jgi:hypothetical protein
MRDRRVLSRQRPAAPSSRKRSCQRQITVLALPVACIISAVPRPSAVRRTIFARQTCFCGLLRLATTALSLLRSARLNWTFVACACPSLAHASSAGNPQANRSVRFGPLVRQIVWQSKARQRSKSGFLASAASFNSGTPSGRILAALQARRSVTFRLSRLVASRLAKIGQRASDRSRICEVSPRYSHRNPVSQQSAHVGPHISEACCLLRRSDWRVCFI